MQFLEVHNISKLIGKTEALKKVSFQQEKSENVAIIGETGSGKSTLLKIIGGLIQTDNGYAALYNKKILGPDEKLIAGHEKIAYLSQHFDLPIHLRVEQALEYANTLEENVAKDLYKICHINHLLKRKTNQLSGGEKQRIALARLISMQPELLLLDEPYSNLDPIHKSTLQTIIQAIQAKWNISVLMVSHNPKDILAWADKIIVMQNGEILQQGSPEEIYRTPANLYIAQLTGNYNIIKSGIKNFLSKITEVEKHKIIVVRPESFSIVDVENANLKGKITEVHFMGAQYELVVSIDQTLVKITTPIRYFKAGNSIDIYLSPKDIIYLNA